MFERFTDRARRVVVLAQQEAMALDHHHVGTEHILLALIREGDGVAAQVLAGAGVGLDRARQKVTELLHGRREADVPAAPAPAAAGDLEGRLTSIAARLDAIERRLRQSASG
jgi:ATP-dependent Clp protease ATP-binding subunit ClpA